LNFGGSGFIPVAGDYDGDGETDVAVYQTSTDNWFVVGSSAGFFTPALNFGGTGFTSLVGDIDGDGKADPVVFQAGNWFAVGSTTGFTVLALNFRKSFGTHFAALTYTPFLGDVDGDGTDDLVVYELFHNSLSGVSAGAFFALGSSTGFMELALNFGGVGFVLLIGDFDGDGRTDIAVYQQSTGNWFVVGSTAGFFSPAVNFGGSGFIPVAGDYDGDGETDVAV
jgi:hypothetical protein